jgi:hypothetical protein
MKLVVDKTIGVLTPNEAQTYCRWRKSHGVEYKLVQRRAVVLAYRDGIKRVKALPAPHEMESSNDH